MEEESHGGEGARGEEHISGNEVRTIKGHLLEHVYKPESSCGGENRGQRPPQASPPIDRGVVEINRSKLKGPCQQCEGSDGDGGIAESKRRQDHACSAHSADPKYVRENILRFLAAEQNFVCQQSDSYQTMGNDGTAIPLWISATLSGASGLEATARKSVNFPKRS